MTFEEILAQQKAEAEASQTAAAPAKNGMSFDEIVAQDSDAEAAKKDGFWGNALRQVVSGGTFGADDEIFGALNPNSTIDEERARKDRFEKAHPYMSLGLKTAGAIGGSFVPMAWAARANALRGAGAAATPFLTGRGAQIAETANTWLNPYANMARLGNTASKGEAALQAGALGAKAGGWQTLGDEKGSIPERLGNIIENPMPAVTNIAGGAAMGGALGAGFKGAANMLDDVRTIAASPHRSNEREALWAINEAFDGSGRGVDDVYREIFGGAQNISDAGRRAFGDAYAGAIGNGANHRTALAAGRDALSTAEGMSTRTAATHARQMGANAEEAFGPHAPLMASERLSGPEAPMPKGGSMHGLMNTLSNSGDAPRGGESAGAIVSRVVAPRQQGALDRTVANIERSVGPNTPIPGNRIDRTTALRRDDDLLYSIANHNARTFDIEPAMSRHLERSQRLGGAPRRELNQTIEEWVQWSNSMKDVNATPAEYLEAFVQHRSALNNKIDQLGRSGDYASARVLRRFKRDIDASAARSNRGWWRANMNSAQVRSNIRALDRGGEINIKSPRSTDEARIAYRELRTDEQRAAFREGLARKVIETLPTEPTHDVGRTFLRGGSSADDDFLRGLLNDVIGGDEAARLFRRIRQERAMQSTSALPKGSQTSALEEARRNRKNRGLRGVLSRGLNPARWIDSLADSIGTNKANAIDAETARRMVTQDLPGTVRLLQDMMSAGKTPMTGTWTPAMREAYGRLQGPLVSQMPAFTDLDEK